MGPLDLKSRQEWDEIVSRFAHQARMTACLTDATGAQLLCHMDRSPLCTAVRVKPEALSAICAQTSNAMLAVIQKTRKPEIDMCEGEMLRLVVPIVREDRLVGQITACGLAPEDEEMDPFRLAKELGISETDVMELAKQSPVASEPELETLVDALFREITP